MLTRTEQSTGARKGHLSARTALSAGLIALAIATIAVLVSRATEGTDRSYVPRHVPVVEGSAGSPPQGLVTGTGPGLVTLADESRNARHGAVVTGTGPGLVWVAGQAGPTEPSGGTQEVSGTGPGLIEIAQRSWAVRLAITGTGPGLVQVAEAR
jgi:hypothetical protein